MHEQGWESKELSHLNCDCLLSSVIDGSSTTIYYIKLIILPFISAPQVSFQFNNNQGGGVGGSMAASGLQGLNHRKAKE